MQLVGYGGAYVKTITAEGADIDDDQTALQGEIAGNVSNVFSTVERAISYNFPDFLTLRKNQ